VLEVGSGTKFLTISANPTLWTLFGSRKEFGGALGSFCLDGDAIWCQKRPPTFQKTISKEYLDQFMKIFLDNFIISSDMESHLMKFKLFFQKCREYRINLNPLKCAFMVFSGLILRFIVSK
jgi:hypothetical protein